MISGLTFRSLIHLEFISVYRVKLVPKFILLCVENKFSNNVYWRYHPFPLCILGTFIKDQLTTNVWTYFWALYCITLIYVSVLISVLWCIYYYSSIGYFEIRWHVDFNFVLCAQYCFGYLFFLCVYHINIMNFRITFSISVKNATWILIGIAIKQAAHCSILA